jgi:hypothetical protein
MSIEKLKVCQICREEKSVSSFNKNKGKSDGLQSQCRDCNKQTSKKYYNSNKELHKQNTVDRKKKQVRLNQQYVYDFVKGKGCIECPEKDPCCLDFDHMTGMKMMNVSRMIHEGYALVTIMDEIDKCVIRCANCHRRKTAKDFNWYCNIDTRD